MLSWVSPHWLYLLLFLEEGYVKMYLKGRPITMFMPKDVVDSYCLEARADLPSNKLKLDWVYPSTGFVNGSLSWVVFECMFIVPRDAVA